MKMKAVTTWVSRFVVDHIKSYAETVIPEFRVQYGDVLVIVNVVDRSLEEPETGVVQANYNVLSQSVRVEVVAPVDITGAWFSKFIPEFKRSLRHELEHFSQHKRAGLLGDVLTPFLTMDGSLKGKPEKGPWTTVGMAARYLLNPVEIEAHVVGIRIEATARRTKFQVVFKEILDTIKENLRRFADGRPAGRTVAARLRREGFSYDTRRRLVRCTRPDDSWPTAPSGRESCPE